MKKADIANALLMGQTIVIAECRAPFSPWRAIKFNSKKTGQPGQMNVTEGRFEIAGNGNPLLCELLQDKQGLPVEPPTSEKARLYVLTVTEMKNEGGMRHARVVSAEPLE